MLDYFTQLNETQKKSIIQMLKTFLKSKEKSTGRISLEEYSKELEEAEKQIEKGEYITHDELLKQIEQWKKKNIG